MSIRLENVGVAVRDLEEAVAFFELLGLTVAGPDEVSGEWADTAVGLDGNHARIALLQTPSDDGAGVELFEYVHPPAIETEPTAPHAIGMHRMGFAVDDLEATLAVLAEHGYGPVRAIANYEGAYLLTYVRGPSGILVMLAQDLRTA